MDQIQRAASAIVCTVLEGRNLNQLLDASRLEHPRLTVQQRAALQDLCYGTLRFYGQLDAILSRLLHKPLHDRTLRCLLLVALYQLIYTRAAAHAVVDHAVHVARKIDPGAAGLTNAILRHFQRQRDALLEAATGDKQGRYSHPAWWVDAVIAEYGDAAEALLEAGNQHPPMTLRVNLRRTSAAEYLGLLAQQEIAARQIGPTAIQLDHPRAVDKLPGFSAGLVSVQDAGAQLAALLLDVHDGMRVLDACAAPGGKTAHILELAKCDLLALDHDEVRLQRVRDNLLRLQLAAEISQGDAAQPGNWWDGRLFDRILADVPCSASGVARRHPDIKWLRRPEDIVGFSQQQAEILSALWHTLADGGKLLYATCSIFPKENKEVVQNFLRQQPDARMLPLLAPGMSDGQLLPNDQHDGFYYALLEKQA